MNTPQPQWVDEGEQRTEKTIEEKLKIIANRLDSLAYEQVTKKTQIEERWYTDLEYYYGKYPSDVQQQLAKANRSQLFVNRTRHKTNAWEARLGDMLFPTDEKNWGIQPTPRPDLIEAAQRAAAMARQGVMEANQAMQAGDHERAREIAAAAQPHAEEAGVNTAIMDEARKRAEKMETTIDDQLRECFYAARARDVIHDGCKLGTGILKGPLARNRSRRKWSKSEDNLYVMQAPVDDRPEYVKVSPFDYFPDMSACNAAEKEFEFERHLYTATDLRRLARRPGFERRADAFRRLLKQGPMDSVPLHYAKMRELADITTSLEPRFLVWEYYGPLQEDDVETLREAFHLPASAFDILDDIRVVMWFCNGEVLNFAPHPLDSGDSLYSIFNFKKDDSSVFGYGVPYLLRDTQDATNGGWRMLMDNGGISAGPQIVIDRDRIEPANNIWEIQPHKLWYAKDTGSPGAGSPFMVHEITNNQTALMNIITLARQFEDDETDMPIIAQGEQAAHVTPTMGGMTILMNSANVVFRHVVRNFDDDLTVPNITRAYDWNMQHNPDDTIKGDMKVDARGSSVLLVREMQATNLRVITENWSVHPMLSKLLKVPAAARKTLQSLMISADEVIKSDEELRRDAEAEANNPPQPTPEMLVAQARIEAVKIDADARLKVADMNRQTEMMKLAETRNMQLEDLRAMLAGKQIDNQHKERVFAAEAAVQERRDREAVQRNEPMPSSGGGYT